jgi:PAS domain S-box-containing protein
VDQYEDKAEKVAMMTTDERRFEISPVCHSLLEASPDPIVIYDMDGKARYINGAFTQTFGWDADELLGKKIDFVPQENRTETQSAIAKMLRGEKVRLFLSKRLTKSGRKLTVQISSDLYYDEAGRPAGNVVILRDVTEVRRVQEALKRSHADLEQQIEKRTSQLMQSNERLQRQISERQRAEKINRTLFQISNAVNATANLEELYISIHQSLGDIIDLSNFYIALYHKKDNAIEFPYFVDEYDEDYYYIEKFTETNSLTGEVILTGEPVFLTQDKLEQRFADGHILGTIPKIWIGVPLKSNDEVIGIMAAQSYDDPDHYDEIDKEILISVSDQVAVAIERKRVVQALMESEEKYRSILESIKDGYYEVDLAGNLTFFNDSLCKMLGYSENELIGKNNREYMDEDNARKIYDTFNRVYRTGVSTKAIGWKLIRKDDTPCYMETVVSLIKDADNRPTGFRGIARDVTEQRLAEEERQQLEKRLQQSQRLEALGKLAGGIAHDFNNLLMGIQGRTSLILADTARSQPFHGQLKGIEEHIQSGAGLTMRLLEFARGGKYEVRPIELNGLIEKCRQMFGRTHKEITIHTNYVQVLPAIEADASQIEQVLLNLFVNAGHAMPDGGSIYIATEKVTLNRDDGKTYGIRRGDYVKLTITDTGIGMDSDTCQKVFDPFFTTRNIGHGTGLGLASAYGIIRNHNGAITVSSAKGQGSTFTIYFPATTKMAVEERSDLPEVVKGTETILLVDDEEIILDVGRQILETMGYHVLTASSGMDAIRLYEGSKSTITLVILDMIMPELGGGAVFDRLKQINPKVKVLLSSGYSINGQAVEIIDRGCSGFIQKPFTLEQLSTKIRHIIDG